MVSLWLCIVLVALLWGGWPLVARAAGDVGPIGSLLIVAGGLVPVALATAWGGAVLPPAPALGKLAVAGLMNGAGLVAFHALATQRSADISIVVPIADTGMLLVTALGGVLFFAEALTVQRSVGVALLVAGIALLRPASA
jgi:drug/metabolite transporter (DMT)-like permease